MYLQKLLRVTATTYCIPTNLTQTHIYAISIPPSHVTPTICKLLNLQMEGIIMQCSECQFENPEGVKFCVECGKKLELICPECGSSNSPSFKFCGECGQNVVTYPESTVIDPSVTQSEEEQFHIAEAVRARAPIEGERKHVTAMFSDLSGYTAMSETLDPEEVKEITSNIFDAISKIITKYEGFVEKFAGDAVMALFGATEVHEDDPVRAIKAAREIHDLVNSLSPQYKERIERPLAMHTGINTGLVVTGEINLEKGTHGVAGDTINVAARLSGHCRAGEILVGPDTYIQAEGYFDFETLEPTEVKGKAKPIQVYRVISQKTQPRKVHRLQGVRAELIGRKAELAQLKQAVNNLREGKSTTYSVCGKAGTGKSRLVEEFKTTQDLKEIQWLEGHAYPYAQNIPYFPLMNLMNKAFQIEEGDPAEIVREKIESGISNLVGQTEDVVPYVGSLYSLNYPEIDDVSPEFWKTRLLIAIQLLLSELSRRAPTIICIEDLHWADPSFLEMIHLLISDFRNPILFLFVYRPTITLFTIPQKNAMAIPYHEIWLKDLSLSESQDMIESLLQTDNAPFDLQRFIQEKVEGNPFYLEEVVNSLIESKILSRDNGSWKLTRPITEADFPSSIHGVLSARIDRLEKHAKRVLQEASVIGRAFLYDILKRITNLKVPIDKYLSDLEQLDLIRTRSLEPDLEYIFKHALTQDVVYNGLLKKERQEIHERTGQTIEVLFPDRLPEFYEALAYHYNNGLSPFKAVTYLMKSGYKNYLRFSLDESHQYYLEAYETLIDLDIQNDENSALLIDLMNQWALVSYFRGDFKAIYKLYKLHREYADNIDDKSRQALYYGWFGFTGFCLGVSCQEQYGRLNKALKLAQEAGDTKAVGYISAWLSWVCGDFGLYDEGISHGERSIKMAKRHADDQYLQFKGSSGLAYVYYWKGNAQAVFELAKYNLDFAKSHKNPRAMAQALIDMGFYYGQIGDFKKATDFYIQSSAAAGEPFYSNASSMGTIFNAINAGMLKEAREARDKHLDFLVGIDLGWASWVTFMVSGVIEILDGRMAKGFKMIMDARKSFKVNERRSYYITSEYLLGRLYSQMAMGEGPKNPVILLKNIGFITKHLPFAAKKAEKYYKKALKMASEIQMDGLRGQMLYDLGLLYKFKKSEVLADQCFTHAFQIFEQIGAKVALDRVRAQVGAD
jgi:class 3 adenylate cyclase/tetratricopeptide (TPR) repeat protein